MGGAISFFWQPNHQVVNYNQRSSVASKGSKSFDKFKKNKKNKTELFSQIKIDKEGINLLSSY